jgi:putative chitinase
MKLDAAKVRRLQGRVGVTADGAFGPLTLDATLAALGIAEAVVVPPLTPITAPPTAIGAGVKHPDVDIERIDAALLKIACPENSLEELARWVEPVKAACYRWGIDTMREVASFLANIGHESSGFTRLEENMNYSAKRMAEVWPGRYAVNPKAAVKDRQPNVLARSLAHSPEKLANNVYANRMGNGPPESGDGWRFRGYGPKQLTGRTNHTRFAAAMGIPLDHVSALIRTREGGMMSAGWFWFDNNLDAQAATPGIEDDRIKINGGLIGVDDVWRRFNALIDEMLKREKAGR